MPYLQQMQQLECWFISTGRELVLKSYTSQKVQLKELILIFWEGEREALQHLLPKCRQLSAEALHSKQHHRFDIIEDGNYQLNTSNCCLFFLNINIYTVLRMQSNNQRVNYQRI